MKLNKQTYWILVISWLFFVIGCCVTAAYMNVASQYKADAKITSAAEIVTTEGKAEEDAEIEQLLEDYYSCLEHGDRQQMLSFVDDPKLLLSQRKLDNMTRYIKSYRLDEMLLYPVDGLQDYIAFVTYQTSFYDTDTEVTGMTQFYIMWAGDHYVIANNEERISDQGQKTLSMVLGRPEVKELIQKITEEREEAIKKDPVLKQFFGEERV